MAGGILQLWLEGLICSPACGILVHWPRIKSMSPALEGGFLTLYHQGNPTLLLYISSLQRGGSEICSPVSWLGCLVNEFFFCCKPLCLSIWLAMLWANKSGLVTKALSMWQGLDTGHSLFPSFLHAAFMDGLCIRAVLGIGNTHSSVLAWGIPGTVEPGGLPSMGSHRVGHDWSDLAVAGTGNGSGLNSILEE